MNSQHWQRQPADRVWSDSMEAMTIRPAIRYRAKLYVGVVLVGAVVTAATGSLAMIIGIENAGQVGAANGLVLALAVNALWIVPSLLLVSPYYNSLRYEVRQDEVIVFAGVITKSVKHVPYRTVTNLETKRGPLDRLFGVGALEIQTAGMSGKDGAEERLAGLADLEPTYQLVVRRLRRYRDGMPPTQAGDADRFDSESPMNEVVSELRAIRDLLAANRL
jgi:membrane protein YdbS with pleckstrin-like domain